MKKGKSEVIPNLKSSFRRRDLFLAGLTVFLLPLLSSCWLTKKRNYPLDELRVMELTQPPILDREPERPEDYPYIYHIFILKGGFVLEEAIFQGQPSDAPFAQFPIDSLSLLKKALLEKMQKIDSELVCIIRSHPESTYKQLIEILDILASIGWTKYAIQTFEKKEFLRMPEELLNPKE